MTKRTPKPTDLNQRMKAVVDEATADEVIVERITLPKRVVTDADHCFVLSGPPLHLRTTTGTTTDSSSASEKMSK